MNKPDLQKKLDEVDMGIWDIIEALPKCKGAVMSVNIEQLKEACVARAALLKLLESEA